MQRSHDFGADKKACAVKPFSVGNSIACGWTDSLSQLPPDSTGAAPSFAIRQVHPELVGEAAKYSTPAVRPQGGNLGVGCQSAVVVALCVETAKCHLPLV